MRRVLFFFTTIMFIGLVYISVSFSQTNTEITVQIPDITEAVPLVPEETEATIAEMEETVQTEPEGISLGDFFKPVEQFDAYNNELQIYVTDQTEIDGNTIKLTADMIDEKYWSGKAESRVAFRYGTFSFRVMTSHKKGIFPAIWMLPVTENRFPEVDIYEAIGNEPYRFHAGIHYDGTDEHKYFFQQRFSKEIAQSTYVLKFEWMPEKLVWYFNDVEVGRITKDCPDMPMYLIFNLAVGGSWAGLPKDDAFPESYAIEILEFAPDEVFDRQEGIGK